MGRTIQCVHCGGDFKPDPRVKNQRYCSAKECQRARKRAWQQEKLRSDPDYKANQRDCQREWHKRHPGYYRQYRERNPKSCERNRLMQRYRNSRKRSRQKVATMDAFRPTPILDPALYYLFPVFATMDASTQKVLIIPVG
jgi:hypothetical protein